MLLTEYVCQSYSNTVPNLISQSPADVEAVPAGIMVSLSGPCLRKIEKF